MEERTFKLSLEKAKMWYNGSSQDLKRIALEVYTEEELTRVELPNSWEEFCKSYKITGKEAFIKDDSRIKETCKEHWFFNSISDKNLLPSEKSAKQHLALMQLHQLRDCYRQGWEPDWNTTKNKYVILRDSSQLWVNSELCKERFLTFDTEELAKKFLENFRDLIKEADDLI